jgi:phospholipid/cholesterol/gamma-HCH transport system substrate-binding protein
MRPFRERNPLPIGIVGVIAILLLLVLGLEAGKLPFVDQGHTYYADFTDSASLQPGNGVRIAGVLVGKVNSVHLEYDAAEHKNVVHVAMKISGKTKIDAGSQANIKIETLLGAVFVDVVPVTGTATLANNLITKTTTPTEITTAFQSLGSDAQGINADQLAKSFTVLADDFRDTPGVVHSSLIGLEKLSTTVASRDSQLQSLLARANSVTNTIATHDAQITKLIDDSNQILQTVSQQRAVIHNLLVDTSALAKQLTGLVADNEKVIGPALTQLKGTLNILRANQKQLDQTLHLAAPFVRDFTDTLGNGRWFETTITNLTNAAGGLKLGNTGNTK